MKKSLHWLLVTMPEATKNPGYCKILVIGEIIHGCPGYYGAIKLLIPNYVVSALRVGDGYHL